MSVRDNLIAAKGLIDTPEKWIKCVAILNRCYCALGAVKRFTGGFYCPERDALVEALPKGHIDSVADYNDDPETTHDAKTGASTYRPFTDRKVREWSVGRGAGLGVVGFFLRKSVSHEFIERSLAARGRPAFLHVEGAAASRCVQKRETNRFRVVASPFQQFR